MNLDKLSTTKRVEYLRMVEGTREALIPSAFSIIDIITYLNYKELILQDPKIPDIFISKGHAASVLYPFIAEKNNIKINYSSDGSSFGIYSNMLCTVSSSSPFKAFANSSTSISGFLQKILII